MKNKNLILGIILLLLCGFCSAKNETTSTTTTTTPALVDITLITPGDVISNTNINNNGSTVVNIDGVNMFGNIDDWSSDNTINKLIKILKEGVKDQAGVDDYHASATQRNALMHYLLSMTDLEIEKFYYSVLAPQLSDLGGGISSNRNLIDENKGGIITNYQMAATNKANIDTLKMEFEAMRRTFERTNPDEYCLSLREIADENGLDRVHCGLHSKVCYNGDIYPQEGGRNFCIDKDSPDFPGCYRKFEGDDTCGHIDRIRVDYNSDYNEVVVDVYYLGGENSDIDVWVEIEGQNRDWDDIYRSTGLSDNRKSFAGRRWLDPGTYTAQITITSGVKEIFDELEFTIESTTTTTTLPTTTTTIEVPGVVGGSANFSSGNGVGIVYLGMILIIFITHFQYWKTNYKVKDESN